MPPAVIKITLARTDSSAWGSSPSTRLLDVLHVLLAHGRRLPALQPDQPRDVRPRIQQHALRRPPVATGPPRLLVVALSGSRPAFQVSRYAWLSSASAAK